MRGGNAIDWESIARGMLDGTTLFEIPTSLAVNPTQSLFFQREGLQSVVIDSTATEIGSNAFKTCRGLTSITIPDSVTTIGTTAFHQCANLTSVTFGNSVSIIMQQSFRDTKLTNITLPASITRIGSMTFYNCPLQTVIIRATTPPTLDNANAFNNDSTRFYVPDASVNDYKAANNWSALASRIFPISDLNE